MKIINIKIKRRENFRPFAPAILQEKKKDWFYNDTPNPFMSSVELIKKQKRVEKEAKEQEEEMRKLEELTRPDKPPTAS